MTEFAAATAVTPNGDGTYAATISPDWFVFTGPNGGYVAAVMHRALTDAVGDPARMARALTVHFLRRADAGPVSVVTRVVRGGRTLTTMAADLYQGDAHVATALAAFATSRPSGQEFHDAVPPYDAKPADTPLSAWRREARPPIANRFEYRPLTAERMFAGGPEAEASAWLRLAEPEPYDPVLLAAVSDAVVPAIFAKVTAPVAATTLDLTVHFRLPAGEPPPDGYCLASFRSTVSADGYVEEDGVMYDESGRLLAQSRQLAVVIPFG